MTSYRECVYSTLENNLFVSQFDFYCAKAGGEYH
jgi:hypothetical protein